MPSGSLRARLNGPALITEKETKAHRLGPAQPAHSWGSVVPLAAPAPPKSTALIAHAALHLLTPSRPGRQSVPWPQARRGSSGLALPHLHRHPGSWQSRWPQSSAPRTSGTLAGPPLRPTAPTCGDAGLAVVPEDVPAGAGAYHRAPFLPAELLAVPVIHAAQLPRGCRTRQPGEPEATPSPEEGRQHQEPIHAPANPTGDPTAAAKGQDHVADASELGPSKQDRHREQARGWGPLLRVHAAPAPPLPRPRGDGMVSAAPWVPDFQKVLQKAQHAPGGPWTLAGHKFSPQKGTRPSPQPQARCAQAACTRTGPGARCSGRDGPHGHGPVH